LRARRERPRGSSAAEQRDERATFQLIEMHPIPRRGGTARGRISKPEGSVSGYRGHFAAGQRGRCPLSCTTRAPCRSIIRAFGQRATGSLSFLFCVKLSLGVLPSQSLIGAPAYVFDAIGFGNGRFLSACPLQPAWHFHDSVSSLNGTLRKQTRISFEGSPRS
jgi:hypothetical protein